ncbi:NACHT domain-containing protein [Komagataeibacter oboediens]|uniref:AAA+ ATPase domain-containing protein n=1 Tax=Komagataeibacter oboediens TaxID=65958 RepID=A0ABS5SMD7_9PROT|nr:hypothetical protein [Komagataeibacter oboediens]MBL7233135.1 hypothetical protein [Komagataeibacter oboediens]MBT0675419.1 hypothetical protein [Komagataeibacter oboediens]MBT0679666.1 hypothetical protein [Komagataeibacter oboediens]
MADVTPITDINRRLKREDPATHSSIIIDQAAILDLDGPVIILGDPGIGKSMLAQKIGQKAGFFYVRASSFVRNAQPERVIPNGKCLVIDGLDEIASAGDGVDAILGQLSKLGHPRFILSSREVDWRGAADRIKIEDDYGRAPTILHLLAFNHNDATHFLRRSFPSVDAESVLTHLAHRGLDEIYKNPLTLRLIGEVAASDEALPTSRAQLLDRACQLLVQEDNPRHQDADRAHATSEKLLLAAGAYAATQILCDIAGLFNGPVSKTPGDCVHVRSIAAHLHAEAIEVALQTRLFEAESSQRFHLLHRVIAEYLGAKWLAHCFQSGMSERRLFSLFGQGHGVPTSLRGLHAWMAHFDDTLAEVCVAADPYAVLRYGDAETVPVHIARRLLGALASLSNRDPFFRAEDWGRHPASGLMRTELKDDILTLIGTPDQHMQLTLLLVEAMAGSKLTAMLEPELRAMMLDKARTYSVRHRAADALRVMRRIDNPAEAIEHLLAQGGEDDLRLAWDLLYDLGLDTVARDLAVRKFYAHLDVTVSNAAQSDDKYVRLNGRSIEALTSTQLEELLDVVQNYGERMISKSGHWYKWQAVDLVHRAGLCALTTNPGMAAADIWRRLSWVGNTPYRKLESTKALTKWFSLHPAVRRAVQSYVVFDAGYEHIYRATDDLDYCGLDLKPNANEVIALIEEFGRRLGDTATDLKMLEELVQLVPRGNVNAATVRQAAAKIGNGAPKFMARLDEWSKQPVHKRQTEREAVDQEREAQRTADQQTLRDTLAKDLSSVDLGTPNLLHDAACIYLGKRTDLCSGLSFGARPETRLTNVLGAELSERVMQGFMASCDRNDTPSARDIVEMRLDRKTYSVALVFVCGVVELLRRGLSVDHLTVEVREAAFMAVRRIRILHCIDLTPLENAVLYDDFTIERFFRTSIEPQLQRKKIDIEDLSFLDRDPRWRPLAGRLAVEWLERFPSLPTTVLEKLLDQATRHANPVELQSLARKFRSRRYFRRTKLAWLALDFLVDFGATYDMLVKVAADNPDFLWCIRDRVSCRWGDEDQRLSVAQYQFIVERFSHAWPQTSHPQVGSNGNTNPWDATAIIENCGYAIGGDPSRDATTALEHLIAVVDPSYLDPLRHALALQLRVRRDSEFTPMSVEGFTAVVSGGLPSTIDDMRAFFGDRIIALDDRMHSTATDMWEAYWNGAKPRDENFCRNRLIEHISGQLPDAIRFVPEMYMPQQKRADIAAILGGIGLPVEIKGQWHPKVWTAPVEQLAARYLHDWHAEGRGAYIVLWFGDLPGKNLPVHPDGLARPKTPDDLRTMLIDRLPENLRDVIDVYVVDVSRPDKKVSPSV